MRDDDKLPFLTDLKNHFSSATEGDADLLWRLVRGYDLADVRHAIETHRLESAKDAWRPDIKRVASVAADRFQARHRSNQQAQRVIDWLYTEAAGMTRADPKLSHEQNLANHFVEAWAQTQQAGTGETCSCGGNRHGKPLKNDGADAASIAQMRRMVYAHAKNAFLEINIPPERADRLARDAVGLEPGESLARSNLQPFGGMQTIGGATLPTPADSFTSLKDLAQAVMESPTATEVDRFSAFMSGKVATAGAA